MITVAMMCHLAIHLFGWNCHKRLCIPVDRGNKISVYWTTEIAIQKL